MEKIDKENLILSIIGYSFTTALLVAAGWTFFALSYGKLIKQYSWTDTVSYTESANHKGRKYSRIYDSSGDYVGNVYLNECDTPKKGDTILYINKRYPFREDQAIYVNGCWFTGSTSIWPVHKMGNS